MAPGPDQIVATVSLQTLGAKQPETVSANPLSIVANPLIASRSPIETPSASAPSAKLIVSSKEKRGGAKRWLYATAAVLCLSAVGVAGLFWYDARLSKEYVALNDQYEALAQASAVALAQPEIVEEVTPEQTEPAASETEDVLSTKPEQDSLDAQKAQAKATTQRPTTVSEPPAPQSSATVAALRPEVKENRPLPPMTSQVTLNPAVSQAADSRAFVPVGTGMAGVSPPAPPPASPPPASKVVVAAEATSKSQPAYPRSAAMAGVRGSVSIQVSINERGAVVDARAVSGPAQLREAAVSAARRWRFNPSTIGGVPVKATKTIVFNFKADR